ncbi:hypothetical protein BDQ17DRAFT_447875 [Cyathus striatus]|nr:hypothetical protein BDQ17DRAFT_447875 [Cyathus striatus]
MAKNWLDTAVITQNSKVYAAFVLVLCGMAVWDVLSTLYFDISIVRGKRPWRWPMVLYFICRICMLLHIFAMAVNLNAISEIPCQEVTWISKIADAIGTCCSSLILVLRTRAVWHRNIKISVGLGLLFLGQIAMWVQTFRYSKAQWNAQRNVCAVISTAPRPLLVAVFAYTMALDLIILLLCTWMLSTSRRSSTLANLLWRDGIGYFCAVFGANLVQMIMAALALNPVMNIIALPFALVISVMASTTVFRNVFIKHDAFSAESTGPGTSGSRGISHSADTGPLNFNRFGPGRFQSAHRTNDIQLGDYNKSHHDVGHVGAISVTRVVDIDVSGGPIEDTTPPYAEKSGTGL